MTVALTTPRAEYVGTGTAGPFAFGFRILDATDLVVISRTTATGIETQLQYPGDFSVTGVGSGTGGTVTLTQTLLAGDVLSIRRTRPIEQATELRNAGPYQPATIERAFDNGVMIAQDLADRVARAVSLSDSYDPDTYDLRLPEPAAGRVLGWNVAGTGLSNLPLSAAQLSQWSAANNQKRDVFLSGTNFTAGTTATLTLAADPGNITNVVIRRRTSGVVIESMDDEFSVVGAVITFTAPIPTGTTRVEVTYFYTYQVNIVDSINARWNASGSGAVARTVRDKLRERVSIADYGGSPSASAAVNTLALQRAMDALALAGGGVLTEGETGEYLVNCSLAAAGAGGTVYCTVLMASNVTVDFGRSTIKVANSQTTNASPRHTAIFFNNQTLKRVGFTNIDFDMNGPNNAVNGLNLLQTPIANSGDGGYVNDLLVDGVTVRDPVGSCCLLLSQTNTVGQVVGTKGRIRNFHVLIRNAYLLVGDHSSISGVMSDCVVESSCSFKLDTVRTDNVTVVWDYQGSNNDFDGYVENYSTGVQIGAGYTAPTSGRVAGRYRNIKCAAINFYREQATEVAIDGIFIDRPDIILDDSATTVGFKTGLQCVTQYPVNNVRVLGMRVTKQGTGKESIAILVAPNKAGTTYAGWSIDGLVTENLYGGVQAQATVGNFKDFKIANSTYRNHRPAGSQVGAFGEQFVVGASCTFDTAISQDSAFINDAGVNFSNGTNVLASGGGTFGSVLVNNKVHKNITIPLLTTGVPQSVQLYGVNLTYPAVWSSGATPITVGDGRVSGYYDLRDGLVTMRSVLTIGSTTVLPIGGLLFTIPVPSGINGAVYLGSYRMYDLSTGNVFTGVAALGGLATQGALHVNGSSNATTASPLALAAGDSVAVELTYVAA